jgi:tetratricopeptide (TPR) repeat protein
MRHRLAVSLLLLTLALIYGQTAGFGYVDIDDPSYVVNNAPVRAGLTADGVRWAFTTSYAASSFPLTWLSLMLDVSLFGLDPGAQHLVNAALHGANALLVYALALALLGDGLASLLVALLFLIHPLHVESVAWITERKDVLCGFFFLSSLLAYLRYAARPSAPRYALVLGTFALALLAKPMAVTLPIALLLLDYWPLDRWGADRSRWRKEVLEKAPLFALSLGAGLWTIAAQAGAIAPIDPLPPLFRVANAAVAYATYLLQTIVPIQLAVIYPMRSIDLWSELVPSLLALAAISIAALRWRTRFPWLLFGWLWFLLTLLPVIGLVQISVQARADRFMYLPSLGLFLALGAAVARLGATARVRTLVALAPALAAYAIAAWIQVGIWASNVKLAEHALAVVGSSFPLHTMLVGAYLEEGRLQLAETHAMEAVKLGSGSALEALAYANLGTVMLRKEEYPDAERMFRMALRRAPHAAHTLNNLGIALERQGRLEEAAKSYAAALAEEPGLLQARDNLDRVTKGS